MSASTASPSPDDIVEAIFRSAAEDPVAAPLAEAFYRCWTAGEWSPEALNAARRSCGEKQGP